MKQTTLLLYGSLTLGLAVTLFGSFEPNDNSWGALGITFDDCAMQFKGYTESINVVRQSGGDWQQIEFMGCQTDVGDENTIITKENEFGTLTIIYDKTPHGVESTYKFTSRNIENIKFTQVIDGVEG